MDEQADIRDEDISPDDDGGGRTQVRQVKSHEPSIEAFDLHKEQERVRGQIAQGLVVVLAITILFAFISLWTYSRSFADVEKLLTIVFGPVIALVGTAIGYYFGGKAAQQGRRH